MATSSFLRQILFTVVLAASIASISGCQKEEDDFPVSGCRLYSVETTDCGMAQLAYDSKGRMTAYGTTDYALFTFGYSGAEVIGMVTTPHFPRANMAMALNAAGYLESLETTIKEYGVDNDYRYTFRYDAEGHLVWSEKRHYRAGSYEVWYYKDSVIYENGNPVRHYSFIRMNDQPYELMNYYHISYTAEENKLGYHAFGVWEMPVIGLWGAQAFDHLLGKASKNLPAISTHYTNTDVASFDNTYTFLLNRDGYPIEETIVHSTSASGSVNRKFSYSCD